MNRIVIFIISTLIVLIGFIFSQNSIKTANSNVTSDTIVLVNEVSIREGPGLSYPVLTNVKDGVELSKLEQQGEWIHVVNGEDVGWVPSWQIKSNEQQDSSKIMVAHSNVDGLNVRAQPNISSAVIYQLGIGDEVFVEKAEQDWLKIDDSTGTTGWVSKEFITLTEKSAPEIPISMDTDSTIKQSHFTIKVNSVNVRKEPNLATSIVGSASQGETFEVLEQNNNWIKIQLNEGEVGWIYRFYGTFDSSLSLNEGLATVTIIYGGTNLREFPSTSSPVVKRAELGETFEILSTEGEWYKIALDKNKTAFVANWVVSSNIKQQNLLEDSPKIERKKGTLNGVTILLDPGHGGNDQGTAGYRGSIEKDYTLTTAQMLQSKLQNAGAKVYLTRESDMYVDLRKRVSIGHQYAVDAFISIHYDATEDSSISGFTTYYYHDYQQKLAQSVNDGIAKKVTLRDRGAQNGDYLVLRENYQNAILIELGYLSNPSEERVITTDFYREQATLGIYEGIINYFDSQLQ